MRRRAIRGVDDARIDPLEDLTDMYDADDIYPGQDASFVRGAGDLRRLRLPSLLATALISSAIVISAAIGRAIGG